MSKTAGHTNFRAPTYNGDSGFRRDNVAIEIHGKTSVVASILTRGGVKGQGAIVHGDPAVKFHGDYVITCSTAQPDNRGLRDPPSRAIELDRHRENCQIRSRGVQEHRKHWKTQEVKVQHPADTVVAIPHHPQ